MGKVREWAKKIGETSKTTRVEPLAEGPEKIVIVMGRTGSGKSSLINRIIGKEVMKVTHGLESGTQSIHIVPWIHKTHRFVLIDTPGFDDTYKTSYEILELIARFLQDSYERKVYVNGILYLQPITDVRITGSALAQLAWIRQLVGDGNLKNVIMVTTFWDKIDSTRGDLREHELKEAFWKPLLDRGARAARSKGDRISELKLIDLVLETQTTILDLQRELVDEKRKLSETTAGKEIKNGTVAQIRQLEDRAAGVRHHIETIEMKGDDLSDLDREELRELAQMYKDLTEKAESLKQT